MKNILKFLTFITVVCLAAVSCDYDDTNFELLTNDVDPNATYYLQFKNDVNSFSTDFDSNGDLVDIETTIQVGLLGMPLGQDLTVNISVAGSSTATSDMFELGSTSLVIAAGTVSAETTFKSVVENMPIDETVTLILNMEAGANVATAAASLTLNLFRPAPCSWLPGIYTINMIDSFGDGWQTNGPNGGDGIQVSIDGVVTEIGMCSPYEGSNFECTPWLPGTDPANDLSFTEATATVDIPEGAQSVKWFFPGDAYGEIGFEILDPDGNSVYKVNVGEGVAGIMPFEVCTNK
jgi:hypothetical protein